MRTRPRSWSRPPAPASAPVGSRTSQGPGRRHGELRLTRCYPSPGSAPARNVCYGSCREAITRGGFRQRGLFARRRLGGKGLGTRSWGGGERQKERPIRTDWEKEWGSGPAGRKIARSTCLPALRGGRRGAPGGDLISLQNNSLLNWTPANKCSYGVKHGKRGGGSCTPDRRRDARGAHPPPASHRPRRDRVLPPGGEVRPDQRVRRAGLQQPHRLPQGQL